MVFNSLPFLIFFAAFFVLYWFVFNKKYKVQNLLILVGSYIFYGWADWRFLSFIAAISAFNFFLGLQIHKTTNEKRRRLLTYLGLIQGIGSLAYFKYFNFFITSFNDLFQSLNLNLDLQTLNILVPLGISFITFKTISYVLDIDNEKLEPTKDWVVFFNYVSFFPTVLSGPIDKGRSFIPQLEKARVFDPLQAADGLRQILWGLFKKIVIADNIATITNSIFDNYETLPASSLLLAAFLYTIQIYADFSGYSDLAIGFARLIGFNVTKNFAFPFFAQNIADFWRKWHISLTTWVTEYVFTPLSIAFRDRGNLGLILAVLINFTIIGIWHGANWTYILFGFLHGCYFIPLILKGTMNKRIKVDKNKMLPTLKESWKMGTTFILVMFSFILFRSETTGKAIDYFISLFSKSLLTIPEIEVGRIFTLQIIVMIMFCMIVEWLGRFDEFAIAKMGFGWKRMYRWAFYFIIILFIFLFVGVEQQFIYFQF